MSAIPYRIVSRSEHAVLRWKWRHGQTMSSLANQHRCSMQTVRAAVENHLWDDLSEDDIEVRQWKANNANNEELLVGLESIDIAGMEQGDGDVGFIELVEFLHNINMDGIHHLQRFEKLGIRTLSDIKYLKEQKEHGRMYYYIEEALMDVGFSQFECLTMFNAL